MLYICMFLCVCFAFLFIGCNYGFFCVMIWCLYIFIFVYFRGWHLNDELFKECHSRSRRRLQEFTHVSRWLNVQHIHLSPLMWKYLKAVWKIFGLWLFSFWQLTIQSSSATKWNSFLFLSIFNLTSASSVQLVWPHSFCAAPTMWSTKCLIH